MSTDTLGKYRIVRELGRSNDVVYEAVDSTINRRVAIKELLLPPNLSGAQRRERVERFYREARAAGSLSHPNIVTIFEAGEDNGRHFIAMELLEGQSLRDVLEIEGNLPLERTVDIVKQVCDALAYAHSRGVVHRDIKPDNVHVLPGGRSIKITDFGIARIMEEPTITADGQVFGTPSYMSPEQVAGKPLDARTDIFSLGVMFYEMLTGRKPFVGDTVVTITYNIMNQEVVYPSSVPPHYERVLRRCLAKDPALRYSSAGELARDMDPNAFQGMQSPVQPDPFSTTTGMPQPTPGSSAPPSSQPAPPPIPSDPFDRLKPGDLSLPKLPPKPLLSREAQYFLKVMLGVLVATAFVVGMVWLFIAGYQGWQETARKDEISVHMDAGVEHFRSHSYNAAIEEFQKALSLGPDPQTTKVVIRNIANCYIELGIQADRTGSPSQAVGYFNQAVEADNSFAEAYLYLGNALKKVNRDDDALSAWGRVVQLGEGSEAAAIARQNAAVVYHERGDRAYNQGNVSDALQWWRRAVEIAPGMPAGFSAQEKIDRVTGE